MRTPLAALAASALLAAPCALAQTRAEPNRPDVNVPPGTAAARPLAPEARTFLTEAAHGGLAEVELGKLAAGKASSPDVKVFGEHMVHDHSKANAELKTLAESRGVTVPDSLSPKHAALKKKLEGLSGDAFDRAYVSEMVKDHRHDVAEFEKAKGGRDADVSAFAAKTLPTLREHLERIEAIAKSMKVSPGSSKSASRKP